VKGWRIVFLVLALASCTSSPPTPNPTVVEHDIVESVLKELCRAVISIQGVASQGNPGALNEHFRANNGWIVLIETSLKTDLEGTVNPSASLLGPIIPGLLVPKGGTAGSFGAAASATFDQTATSLRDGKRYVVLDALLNSQLCPAPGSPEYTEIFHNRLMYTSDKKYLEGKLGIREWLWESVSAQNFDPIINPTTTVVEGPLQNDPIQQEALAAHKLYTAMSQQNFINSGVGAPGGDTNAKCTSPINAGTSIPTQNWSQGQLVSGWSAPLPFISVCPLSYDTPSIAQDPPPNTPSPVTWLKARIGNNAATNTADIFLDTSGPIPGSASGSYKITITTKATNNDQNKNTTTLNIIVTSPPKATSWGPVYGATFTFVIKSSGQLGPSFSFDKVKGGSATLFSMSRTETNYVNIVLTSVGIPLLELNPDGTVKVTRAGTPVASVVRSPGSVDLIDKAMSRLDNTLQKLNNAQIGVTP
jgi:hypothetical protein